MRSDRRVAVAIVGGGASGTILAAQLARRGIDTALIEGTGRIGRGVAYSTQEPRHLLNVRADGMSAWADDVDHFARRFAADGGEPRGFATRRLFGDYLCDILAEAVGSGFVRTVECRAVAAERSPEGWTVATADSDPISATALVLANGNQPPEPLRALADAGRRYIANPWGNDARTAVADLAETGGTALLIGTGLTMVDVVLSLDAAGHDGRVVAVSRRGQVPRAHADFEAAPVDEGELPVGDLVGLWRWLRARSAAVGWRAAVDSLRPYSRSLWQGLGVDQQRRFMRHARPWWDVHRHRIAPEIARLIKQQIAAGRLEIIAGRIRSVAASGDFLNVSVRRRGLDHDDQFRADYAFNCTGPLHAIRQSSDPILRHLLDRQEVLPDALGIGLAVDPCSRASDRLWAIGPLTKGRFWEVVAVPDIREQAAHIAEDIARELDR